MKRQRLYLVCLLFMTTTAIFAQDTWTQKTGLPANINLGSYGCSIGNKGYVLVGSVSGSYFENAVKRDFWAYDPATAVWTKKADAPADVSYWGVALSIGNKGYFSTSNGYWEYDPAIDVWTRQLTPPAGFFIKSGFSIGNKGYFIGGGTLATDFWEYDPTADSWTQKTNFPGSGTSYYVKGFSIGTKGYVAASNGLDPANKNDFWEYDPATNAWTQKASFGGATNDVGSDGFSIGGKGYIATFFSPTPYFFTEFHFWEYVPATNTWSEKAAYGGIPRGLATGFAIGNKGYIGFGVSTYRTGAAAPKDFWEYTPIPTDAPPSIIGSGAGLRGAYYHGINLSGTAFLTKIDTTINFDIPFLSKPPYGIPGDNYSVRWNGQVQAQYSETYTFYTQSDDGIRLWVNGVQLIDNWTNQGVTEKSGTIALQAGQKYDVVVEYYENTGDAVSRLLWSSPSTTKAIVPKSQLYPPPEPISSGTGLLGTYYNDVTLSGAPLITRIDTTINFDLSYGKNPQVLSPSPGIVPEDKYSVRWSGQVQPLHSETYTFYTSADDGVRLWVNGVQLIDDWNIHGVTQDSGTITLGAGFKYDIVVEYFENFGDAVTKLYWSSPSTPKAIIPKAQLYPPARGIGLKGDYYNYTDANPFSGKPLLTRIDSIIDFSFVSFGPLPYVLSPAPGVVPNDKYSVRWSGQVLPEHSQTYTFTTGSDDGIRLWVNGELLIDNWTLHGGTLNSGSIALLAGQKYDIVIEYFEYTGDAYAELYWSGPGVATQIIPQANLFPPAANNTYMPGLSSSLRMMPATESIAAVPASAASAGISPNPATAGKPVTLTIKSDKNAVATLNISNSNGAAISARKLNLVTGVNTVTLSTSGFAPGLYVINVAGGSKPFNMKLVIQ